MGKVIPIRDQHMKVSLFQAAFKLHFSIMGQPVRLSSMANANKIAVSFFIFLSPVYVFVFLCSIRAQILSYSSSSSL